MEMKLNLILKALEEEYDKVSAEFVDEATKDDGSLKTQYLSGQETAMYKAITIVKNIINADEGTPLEDIDLEEEDEEDEEDYDYDDSVDETNYDPYMGCDSWDY